MVDAVRRRFFAELGDAERAVVRGVATVRRTAARDVLCHEGEPLDHAFVVCRGLVAVRKTAANGRQVVLELRGAGELVGELAILDGGGRTAMMCVVEAGELLVVSAVALQSLVRTNPAIAHALLVTLASHVRQSADRHLELGTAESLPRVARRLHELWELRGRETVFESPLSQQDLADWAGVSRDGVVRALTTLRAEGVVETGRRRFAIHDAERLRSYFR